MSELNPEESERRLTGVLREWRVESPPPPGFEDRVWHRISSYKQPVVAGFPRYFMDRIDVWFSRPAMAITYVSLLLVVGLAAGSWQARRESARVDQALARLYVQSVDPYQAPRH